MSQEAQMVAQLVLEIEKLREEIETLKSRQNYDIRVQELMPLRCNFGTLWIKIPEDHVAEWVECKVMLKRSSLLSSK